MTPTGLVVGTFAPLGLAAVISYAITAAVRRHALKHSMLDVPNERSSHTTPTPRGGGLAIATVSLSGIVLLSFLGFIPRNIAIALFGGGVLVAGIGWADDRASSHPLIRFLVQAIAAVWALWWIGGLPSIRIGESVIRLGPFGDMLAALAVIWLTNLYNFMDGIDGIAAGEAVTAGGIAGLLLVRAGDVALASLALLLVSASFGFLVWNWPPAKIFMGDVGSGLLGFLFACLAVASENAGSVPVIWWVVLFLVFVFDATATLLRRALKREKVYAAHREHAYQRAVANGNTHRAVTMAVLLMNLLLGLLAATGMGKPKLAWLAILASFGLVSVFYWFVERKRPMFTSARVIP